ncbi:MAG: hypothetical protein LBD81_01980, partial [Holosporaceae bacterium]|nr:hypothetical protein [Holosporaceae bacterium]
MKLIHKIIDIIKGKHPPRNISSINYWKNNLDTMVDHYLNKKTCSDLESEMKFLEVVFNDVLERLWWARFFGPYYEAFRDSS